jgi:hypothetical protein
VKRPAIADYPGHLAMVITAVAAWFGTGAVLVMAALALRGVKCADGADPLWVKLDWEHVAMAALCVAAFAAGRGTFEVRLAVQAKRFQAGAPEPPFWAQMLLQGTIAAFFLFVLGALLYETLGMYDISAHTNPEFHPITTYVRCAISHAPVRSTLVASAVSYLIGHWLWFR